MFMENFFALFGNVLVGIWAALTLGAAAIGVWALVAPASFITWSRRLSIWVEMGRADRDRDRGISLERPFYRYHLVTGPLIIAGALFVVYEVLFRITPEEIKPLFVKGSGITSVWIEILIDTAFGWIYISSFFAFTVGVVVTLRPSYLKGIERKANLWVDTRDLSSVADKRNDFLDKWVSANPRWFGILALSGSLVVAYLIMRLGYQA